MVFGQFQDNDENLFSKTDKEVKGDKYFDKMDEIRYTRIGKPEIEFECCLESTLVDVNGYVITVAIAVEIEGAFK